MKTARPPVLALAVSVLAVGAAGCAVPASEHATRVEPERVPFDLLDPEARPLVPTTAGPTGEPVELCFVRDGRLLVEQRPLDPPVRPEDAIEALGTPPRAAEAVPTARTALTDPSVVSQVAVAAGVARVDLRASISELGGDEQLLAVAQIVCTVTALPGVGQVSFALEGTPVDVPRGDGSLVAQPVSRDDYRSLLP